MIKLVASQCLILTSPKLVVPVGFVSRIPSRITHGRVCPAVLSGRVLSSALLWSLVLGRCEFEKLAWWGPPLGAKARLVLRADLFAKPAIHTCTWQCFVWSWPSRSRGRSKRARKSITELTCYQKLENTFCCVAVFRVVVAGRCARARLRCRFTDLYKLAGRYLVCRFN